MSHRQQQSIPTTSKAARRLRLQIQPLDLYGIYRSPNKKIPKASTDPEDCTRNSSSPVPQPTRERRSTILEGLLAHGSPYSPRLPIRRSEQWHVRVSSPCTAAGPRGIFTLFPAQESLCGGHSRRGIRRLSSSLMSFEPSPAHVLRATRPNPSATERKAKTFHVTTRHRVCSPLYIAMTLGSGSRARE